MQNPQRDIISFYSDPATAASFHEDRYGGALGAFFLQEESHAFRRVAGPLSTGMLVLDLGAGTGKLGSAFCGGPRLMGLDRSIEMLRELRRRDPSLPLVVGDAQALPLRSHSVDMVTASRLLMHLPDWRSMVRESCRVARREVLVDFPVSPSLAALEPRLWRIIRRDGHPPHRIFTRRRVRRAFEAAGFVQTRAWHGFVIPYRVHRMIGAPRLSKAAEHILARVGIAYLIGSPAVVAFSRFASSEPPG